MNVLIYIHRLWRKELGEGGEGRVGLKENEHKNVVSFKKKKRKKKSVSKRKKRQIRAQYAAAHAQVFTPTSLCKVIGNC